LKAKLFKQLPSSNVITNQFIFFVFKNSNYIRGTELISTSIQHIFLLFPIQTSLHISGGWSFLGLISLGGVIRKDFILVGHEFFD